MQLAVSETLFGAIAAFSALLGVAMTILSYIAGRKNAAELASEDCHERLLASQRQAEQLSEELHELRMQRHVIEP